MITLNVSIYFVSFSKHNNIAIADNGNETPPIIRHIFPMYLCAKSQVFLFFIDIEDRYPKNLLISFGPFLQKTNPKNIIIRGSNITLPDIRIQKPIPITSIGGTTKTGVFVVLMQFPALQAAKPGISGALEIRLAQFRRGIIDDPVGGGDFFLVNAGKGDPHIMFA